MTSKAATVVALAGVLAILTGGCSNECPVGAVRTADGRCVTPSDHNDGSSSEMDGSRPARDGSSEDGASGTPSTSGGPYVATQAAAGAASSALYRVRLSVGAPIPVPAMSAQHRVRAER
jgi:hypothetical protein